MAAKIPRDEEGVNPLERGRRLYQRKDYPGALEAFSDAIKVSSGSLLLTALDHRAASYEKLNKLQAALRDSKEMIELNPDLAKGYLRCGKVLQVKGEKDLALKIYERGLRKVKIGVDNDRTVLQSMFNKLRQSFDPGKCLDPLAFLPFELAEMVMHHLEMRDRVICLAVSKSWKSLLEASPKLWTTFDTRTARRSVSLQSLKKHLRRSKYTLDKAVINWRAKFDGAKMEYLMRTCKHLQHLEMDGSGSVIGDSLTNALPLAQNLRTLIISETCHITPKAMLLALKICRETLVKAAFLLAEGRIDNLEPWPRLESMQSFELRVSQSYDRSFFNPQSIVDSIPNARALTLIDCDISHLLPQVDMSQCKHLESLRFGWPCSPRLPLLPPSLRHLNLDKHKCLFLGNNEDEEGVDGNLEPLDLPLLESFDCCKTTIISTTIVTRIIMKSIQAGRLTKLFIGAGSEKWVYHPRDDVGYPASDSVRELSVASMAVSEARIRALVALYPNVRKLDVSKTKITGVAIKEFVSMGVTHLRCVDCYDTSPDAIDFARAQGVVVEARYSPIPRGANTFRDSSWARALEHRI